MLGVRSLWAADLARSPLFSTASRPAPAQAFSGMSAHCSAPTRPVFCPLLSVFPLHSHAPITSCWYALSLGTMLGFLGYFFLQLVSTTWKLNIVLLCPCRNRLGALSNVDHCPSVCSMPDTKSRMEGHRKLKIGRREARVMGHLWPHLQIKRSKVKVSRPINAETANWPYHWNGALYYSNFVHRWNTTRINDVCLPQRSRL